jgi:hypothetical protein
MAIELKHLRYAEATEHCGSANYLQIKLQRRNSHELQADSGKWRARLDSNQRPTA